MKNILRKYFPAIKKLRSLALVPALVFISTSCSQDILDINPATDISENDIFASEKLLEFYVNGRYYSFPDYNFGIQDTDPISDDMYASSNGAAMAYGQGLTTSTFGVPQDRWATNYANIRDVNFFFSRIDKSNIDAAVKKRLTGEMRFIRAWLYLDLISLYGDVILITDLPALNQANFDVAKTPYQDVVAFIISEMNLAAEELPNISFNGRASKGAALALKARTLLYAASPLHNGGSYDRDKLQQASEAAQAVIDLGTYSLETDFANIYNTPNYSKEIIFARTFNSSHIPFNLFGVTSGDRYYLPAVYSDVDLGWAQPLQSLVDAFEMSNGKLITDPSSGYDPQNPYNGRDPRFSKSIIHHGAILPNLAGITDAYNNGNGTITVTYHKDAGNNSSKNGNSYNTAVNSSYNILKMAAPGMPLRGIRDTYKPWIHFRLAEMYLIVAEAQAELGNTQVALNALNQVRKRAGMPNLQGISGTELRSRYRNEKRVEFAFENMRWYDITRWKIAPEVIPTVAKGVSILRSSGVDKYDYDANVLDNKRAWDNKMYYMPLPFSEVQANRLLKQNAGYD